MHLVTPVHSHILILVNAWLEIRELLKHETAKQSTKTPCVTLPFTEYSPTMAGFEIKYLNRHNYRPKMC